jgi:hypothetical protein
MYFILPSFIIMGQGGTNGTAERERERERERETWFCSQSYA